MSALIKQIPHDQFCFDAYSIIGTDYIIEYVPTIFNGIRVTLRKKDDTYLYFNWCAGKHRVFADYLRNVIGEIVVNDNIDLYPLCSNIKPFFNDDKFCELINKVLPIPGVIKIGKNIIFE